jgi:hypothetical protein
MPKYLVTSTIHLGTGKPGAKFTDGEKSPHKVYNPGETIELTEAEAARMLHAVKPIEKPANAKGKDKE